MVFRSYLLFSSHGPPTLPSFSPLFSSPPPLILLPFFHLVLFILFQPSGLCSFSPTLFLSFYHSLWASLIAQLVKNLPAMLETWVGSLEVRKGYPLQYSVRENSMDYSPWECKESDTTERFSLHLILAHFSHFSLKSNFFRETFPISTSCSLLTFQP